MLLKSVGLTTKLPLRADLSSNAVLATLLGVPFSELEAFSLLVAWVGIVSSTLAYPLVILLGPSGDADAGGCSGVDGRGERDILPFEDDKEKPCL